MTTLAGGITFMGAMVRAILDGRKTQTRRPLKVDHDKARVNPDTGMLEVETESIGWVEPRVRYAQEHWYYIKENIVHDDDGIARYQADDAPVFGNPEWRWKRGDCPARHMPTECARMAVYITNVYGQRLLDISENDAVAEGVGSRKDFLLLWDGMYGGTPNASKHNPFVWVYAFVPKSRETPGVWDMFAQTLERRGR